MKTSTGSPGISSSIDSRVHRGSDLDLRFGPRKREGFRSTVVLQGKEDSGRLRAVIQRLQRCRVRGG